MANPIVFPAELSFAGLAKETNNGQAVAPSRFFPFQKFDMVDDINLQVDDAMRGSMASEFGGVPGNTLATGDLSTYFYPDSAGDLLYNIFGGYAVGTAVSGVYPHTFSLLNSGDGQPPAHTFTDRTGITATVGARAYSYACLSELTIAGNATGLVSMDAKLTSYVSAPAGAAPTNAVTVETVIPGWRSSVSIAGSAATNIREWTITIARALNVVDTADGTQNPYAIARGDLTATGKLTFAAKDESPLIAFLAGTQQAVAITVDNGGLTAAVRQLVITATATKYNTESMVRATPIGYAMDFKCFANSTDVGASGGLAPVQAVLKNAVTTY
jgi:hypothetical protein